MQNNKPLNYWICYFAEPATAQGYPTHIANATPLSNEGCNVGNLDTGAAFTGKLSLMDINTKEFWQSDPVWKLYPGEKGRNKD